MFPFALLFGAIGAVASIAGTVVQANAAHQQAEESKHQEALRQQQVALESNRQRRQTIRNTLKARSRALVAGSADGASFGSGAAGGLGQIGNKNAENTLGINQSQKISNDIFASNGRIADAQSLSDFGGGLSSLGQTVSGLKVG